MPSLVAADGTDLAFVAVGAEVICLLQCTGERVATYALADGMGSVAALDCSSPKVFMASDTGALLAYDITSQLQCWVRKLEGVGNIGRITAGTRSEVLFVLGTDKFVVIDQLTGSVKTEVPHISHVILHAASPLGVLAAVQEDGFIRAWRLVGDEAVPLWSGAAPPEPSCMSICDDFLLVGSAVVTCYSLVKGSDASPCWSTESRPGDSDDTEESHTTCLKAVTKSGTLHFAVGRANNVVQGYADESFLWEARHGRCGEGREGVTSLDISADGSTCHTGANDHCVRAWELHSGQPILGREEMIEVHGRADPGTQYRYCEANHGSHEWGVQTVLAIQGSECLLSAGHDGHVRFWDTTNAAHLWGYKHGMDVFHALVQGSAIFAGVTNYTVQRWDATTGEKAWSTFLGDAMRAMDMAVHDGVVYVAVVNCRVFALDATSGTILWQAIPIKNWTVMVQAHAGVVLTGSNCDTTDMGEHKLAGWKHRVPSECDTREGPHKVDVNCPIGEWKLWEQTEPSNTDLGAVVSSDDADGCDVCVLGVLAHREDGVDGSHLRGVRLGTGVTVWENKTILITMMRTMEGQRGMLVAGSTDGSTSILGLSSGVRLLTLSSPADTLQKCNVSQLAVSSDGNIFVVLGTDCLAAYMGCTTYLHSNASTVVSKNAGGQAVQRTHPAWVQRVATCNLLPGAEIVSY